MEESNEQHFSSSEHRVISELSIKRSTSGSQAFEADLIFQLEDKFVETHQGNEQNMCVHDLQSYMELEQLRLSMTRIECVFDAQSTRINLRSYQMSPSTDYETSGLNTLHIHCYAWYMGILCVE